MERRAVIISVNDTFRPRTGEEYVFRMIKTELLRLRYQAREFSNLIGRLKAGLNMGNFDVFSDSSHICFTRSYPFMNAIIVYHQPKAGMCCSDIEAFLSPYMRLGVSVLENERISPQATFYI